jgi:hypothetical protein
MPNKKLFASLLFVAACGGSTEPAQPDTNLNNVAAVIADGDGPVAGVEVVFVNPDGKVAADVKTGDDGRAEAQIEPGASVTAAVDGLTTVTGLQPGDGIAFGPKVDPTLGKDTGAMNVKFASATGATKYDLFAACSTVSGAASPLAMPVHSNCGSAGDLLAVASDANGIQQYAVDAKVSVSKGDYELAGTWQAIDSINADVSGIDAAAIGAIKVQTAALVGFTTDKADIPTAAAANTTALKAALGEHAGYALFVDDKAGAHHQTLLAPLADDATDAKIDVSKDLLAWVTGVSYDAGTHTATVQTSAGDKGGLLEIDLAYGSKGAWHVFGPSAGTSTDPLSIELPALPASLASLAPAASDTVSGAATLIDVEGETYKTLRALAPMAVFHYTGHPEIAAPKKIRTSK